MNPRKLVNSDGSIPKFRIGIQRSPTDLTFTVKEDGVALDISSWISGSATVNAIIKRKITDEDAAALAKIVCTFVTDGTDGKFKVPLSTATIGNSTTKIDKEAFIFLYRILSDGSTVRDIDEFEIKITKSGVDVP